MSIITTGRKIKVIFNDELKDKKQYKDIVNKFNHFNIVLLNKTKKSLLFTNDELERGYDRAYKFGIDTKISWLKEFWLDDFIDVKEEDFKEIIDKKKLPEFALKYNHIRIFCDKKEFHFLFTDNEIKKALEKEKKHYSLSWINKELTFITMFPEPKMSDEELVIDIIKANKQENQNEN